MSIPNTPRQERDVLTEGARVLQELKGRLPASSKWTGAFAAVSESFTAGATLARMRDRAEGDDEAT